MSVTLTRRDRTFFLMVRDSDTPNPTVLGGEEAASSETVRDVQLDELFVDAEAACATIVTATGAHLREATRNFHREHATRTATEQAEKPSAPTGAPVNLTKRMRKHTVAYRRTWRGAEILQVIPGSMANAIRKPKLGNLRAMGLEWVTVRARSLGHALALGREAVTDAAAEQHERSGSDVVPFTVATRLLTPRDAQIPTYGEVFAIVAGA